MQYKDMAKNVPVAHYNTLDGLHRTTNGIISSPNDLVELTPIVRLLNKRLNCLKFQFSNFLIDKTNGRTFNHFRLESINVSPRVWHAVYIST